MFSFERDSDTICATATPIGTGALAIVRLSGPHAIEIARKVAGFLPVDIESHRIYYGYVKSAASGEIIDEVLASYFAHGRSFTGETSFEFSCHGNPVITHRLIQALIEAGARLAQKGEFTYRAFANGRIDLVQAEGVLSVIESQSVAGSRLALRQLKGELSSELALIEENLTWCLSRLEANLDFSTEFIEFASNDEILRQAQEAFDKVQNLLKSYSNGRVLQSGLRVALVGAPNVGKSSLLNCLVRQERAIVSPVAGTTRDVIEVELNLDGQKVVLVDTAGLRVTEDEIERLGVEKTYKEIQEADIVCLIRDITDKGPQFNLDMNLLEDKRVIRIENKADMIANINAEKLTADISHQFSDSDRILLSAVTGQGVSDLLDQFRETLFSRHEENSVVLLSARHFELLTKAHEHLKCGLNLLVEQASSEFVISEIQEALSACFEILGRRFNDEILDRVFRDFCLGK